MSRCICPLRLASLTGGIARACLLVRPARARSLTARIACPAVSEGPSSAATSSPRAEQDSQTAPAAVNAVLFDFGGVITESPFEAFNRYEDRIGVPRDTIRQINATNPDTNAWARLERKRGQRRRVRRAVRGRSRRPGVRAIRRAGAGVPQRRGGAREWCVRWRSLRRDCRWAASPTT